MCRQKSSGAGCSITPAPGSIFYLIFLTMPQASPAKDWCFTINNPSEKTWNKIWAFPYKYLVFQVEVGENGTPHVQGFVQFEDKLRLTALKKLHKKAHWEKRRGTPDEAANYCKKEDSRIDGPYEDGYMSYEATMKLHMVAKAIKENGLDRAIERFPESYLSLARGMESLAKFYAKPRDPNNPPVVTVLYGKSGAGKTRYAMECFPQPYLLGAAGGASSSDFVGDYRPLEHQTFVLEEFYGDWKFRNLLRILDRYPNEVQTKGGYQQFLASHVVITSNVPPDEWYPKLTLAGRTEPLHRRIHNLIEFTEFGYVVKKGTSTQN